jgi:hypothetical protein
MLLIVGLYFSGFTDPIRKFRNSPKIVAGANEFRQHQIK